jgi:hypothetical protein
LAASNKIKSVEILSGDDWTVADGSSHTLTAVVTMDGQAPDSSKNVKVVLSKDGKQVSTESEIENAAFTEKGNWQAAAEFEASEAGSYVATAWIVDSKSSTTVTSAVYTVAQGGGVVDNDRVFADGTVTQAVDNTGRAISAGEDGSFTFAYDGQAHWVVPQAVTTAVTGQRVDVLQNVAGSDDPAVARVENIAYYADTNENGTYDQGVDQQVAVKSSEVGAAFEYDIVDAGTYFVVSKADPEFSKTAVNVAKFTITAGSLEGAVAYQGDDASSQSFVFNGEDQQGDFKFALNGTELKADDDYTVAWYNADGSSATAVTNAGKYTARLTGAGKYAGSTVNVPVEIAKFDLAGGSVYIDDVVYEDGLKADSAEIVAKAEGVKGLNGMVKKTLAGPIAEVGSYTVTVEPKDEAAEENLTGAAQVTFNVVTATVPEASFEYDGDPISDWSGKKFDMATDDAFDASKVSVVRYGTIDYPKSSYTVTVTDEDGNVVAAPTATGKYTLTVAMNPGADFSIGGKIVKEFEVTNGNFANAVVTALYDGKVLSGQAIEYTGEDVVPGIELTVSMGGKELAAGTDYDVKYTDAAGAEVESIVDVKDGGYKLLVEPKTFSGADVTISFSVAPVTATALKVDKGLIGGVAYTGEPVVPTVLYTTSDEGKDAEDSEWAVLPADLYKLSFEQDGKAVDASKVVEGEGYTAIVALYGDVVNYDIATANTDLMTFDIVKTAEFVDVPADAWYAGYVAKSSLNGFMNGVASGIFAPERAMTRAEFAQTIYNMAHKVGEQGPNNAWETYPTQFSDVEPNAWYAKAVEWASRYGIVNGTSETTFDPNGTVTREQIATMLYRYIGGGAQADASVLDKFEDKADVSGWAEQAMAWAVSEGVVNGASETRLDPQGEAQRCMIAAMAVRAQPERIENM